MSEPQKKAKTHHISKHAQQDQRRQEMADTDDKVTMPDTGDEGDAVSQDSLYDASGAATGGGVDLSTHLDKKSQKELSKHIHQGTSS
ncbi:hypothetical protein KDA_57400 [Dictyobacter alpinus]|uniref:Uncharacterized protein n=1 Tax=Dictyobacter alpinus TaxID=2014873 RepID=A0A402BFY4_9CHLR|nr:hypothetical protein [Dictyobacter alpinus]GCE30256.1 hypothetical protein KDA_57400 [Dictyobacter alpinus]